MALVRCFFIALAIANEIVWRHVSTNIWVAFKVWAVFPLTVLFAMAQTTIHHAASDRRRGKAPPTT